MPRKKTLLSFVAVFGVLFSVAQDVNLDSLLDSEIDKKTHNQTQQTEATFKSSRLINSHTVETTQKGVLDLKIAHRFSPVSEGFYSLFGIDNAASMRFGADYGLTNRLTIGGGRSSFEKEYDAFIKYRLLWQSTGKQNVPLSLTLLSSVMLRTFDTSDKLNIHSENYSFAFQALLARKFSSNFSLQLMPTLVHVNYGNVAEPAAANLYSLGVGARFKLTKRSGVIAEYYYQLPGSKLPGSHNSLSVGYEIETGGHVFQFNISNSRGLTERTFITQVPNDPWSLSNLQFGFGISRVFTLRKTKSDGTISKAYPLVIKPVENKDTSAMHYAVATFKTTRLINGHTVETTQGGVLDLKVTHRFGELSDKFYKMFGLDEASMRFGLDYGINDRLTIGGGRSTNGKNPALEKGYDAFLKYKLLRQSAGKKNVLVSVSLLSSVIYNSLKINDRLVQYPSDTASKLVKINISDRFAYAFEAIIARKFCDGFSLQIMPTMVHYNIVEDSLMHNDHYAIGVGARFKLTQRSSFNIEYYYQLQNTRFSGTSNSFALGYEIETAGHVFQLQLTNSYGMTEKSFINETTGKWNKGNIHFGFNISRVFAVKKVKNI